MISTSRSTSLRSSIRETVMNFAANFLPDAFSKHLLTMPNLPLYNQSESHCYNLNLHSKIFLMSLPYYLPNSSPNLYSFFGSKFFTTTFRGSKGTSNKSSNIFFNYNQFLFYFIIMSFNSLPSSGSVSSTYIIVDEISYHNSIIQINQLSINYQSQGN